MEPCYRAAFVSLTRALGILAGVAVAIYLAVVFGTKPTTTVQANTTSFSAAADTMIIENSPDSGYDDANPLKADGDNPAGTGSQLRPLLRWDVSRLPAGAKIESAKVTLNVTNSSPNSFAAHKLLKSWSEVGSTWTQAGPSSDWQVAGADGGKDRESAASGEFTPSSIQQTSFDLNASVVAGWRSEPSSNRGIILLGPSSPDGFSFSSRENASYALRPTLTVTYLPADASPAGAPPAAAPPSDTASSDACTSLLQAKIDDAPSGAVVTADPCIYRETVTIDKPLTLRGRRGSEIRGSDVWTGFERSGSTWESSETVPSLSASGECAPDTSGCRRPEQVFLDGKPLEQLDDGETPSSGQFALSSDRRVVLGDNPAGKTVEVSVRREWVVGHAPDVTIEGFEMKHAANDSQYHAALTNDGNDNWTLKDSELSHSHGTLVSLEGASGLRILDNELHHGGQSGVHSSGSQLVLSGNEIHHNNTSGFDPGWEAGGVKTSRMDGLLAENNRIHNNDGHGLWCDIGCRDVTYRYNTIHHNGWSGIFFEVSEGAKIHSNAVYENGWGKGGPSSGSWQGAIHVSNSRGADVYDNTVAWNRSNISVVRIDRSGDYPAYNDVRSNVVRGNRILSEDYSSAAGYDSGSRNHALAWVDKWTGEMYEPSRGNRGYSNEYYFAAPASASVPRFFWGGGATSSLASFNATAGEEGGRYMSRGEKDALAAAEGVPPAPEH